MIKRRLDNSEIDSMTRSKGSKYRHPPSAPLEEASEEEILASLEFSWTSLTSPDAILQHHQIVVELSMNNTFEQLADLVPVTLPHRFEIYRHIIRESCGIEAANRAQITVVKTTGTERIDLPEEGMTEELYDYLSPRCDESERGLLAKAVVENLIRPDWQTWDEFQAFFSKARGEFLEEFLPEVVERRGFQEISSLVRDAISRFRLEYPKPTLNPSRHPMWDAKTNTLCYGKKFWKFPTQASSIIAILEALHANGWNQVDSIPVWESPAYKQKRRRDSNPLQRDDLKSDQIGYAVNQLRKKTKGILTWHRVRLIGVSWKPLGCDISFSSGSL